jgi:hypothetical protein
MWTNLLILLVNSVLLVLTLASRLALHGGSLEQAFASLPWTSFGTELGELLWADSVSAAALMAAWLSLTAGWIAISVAHALLGRRAGRRKPEASVKRPEPGFMQPQEVRQDAPPALAGAVPPAQADLSAAPSSTASPADLADQLAGLRARAARLSPEAQHELERLQSALAQLQKT